MLELRTGRRALLKDVTRAASERLSLDGGFIGPRQEDEREPDAPRAGGLDESQPCRHPTKYVGPVARTGGPTVSLLSIIGRHDRRSAFNRSIDNMLSADLDRHLQARGFYGPQAQLPSVQVGNPTSGRESHAGGLLSGGH